LRQNARTLIIDTKWKLPEDNKPSDSDLKQMFMYNEYWQNANAILFYPKDSGELEFDQGVFVAGGRVPHAENNARHKCGIFRASVLQSEINQIEPTLDTRFGEHILMKLAEQELI
jgi:5-methylcytosine-specific restriction enzyme subunit McrC